MTADEMRRLLDALDVCESNRGRFSTAPAHDARCPKARAASPEQWRGEWVCHCGAEELERARQAAASVLGG